MAENVNISSSVDTSAIDKMSAAMQKLNASFTSSAERVAAFNKANQASEAGVQQRIVNLNKAVINTQQYVQIQNQLNQSIAAYTQQASAASAATAKGFLPGAAAAGSAATIGANLAATTAAIAAAPPPPLPPPIALGGAGAGGGGARATRLAAIQGALSQLGVDAQNLDSPAFERARAKINALALEMGLATKSVTRLGEALNIVLTGSLDPTDRKTSALVNHLQGLVNISDANTIAQNKLAAELRKVNDEAQKASAIASRQAAAPAFVGQAIGALGGTPEALAGLPADKANTVRVAIDRLNQALATGKLSLVEFNAAFERVTKGGFDPLSSAASKAATELTKVNDILKEQASSAQRTGQINQQVANALKGIGLSQDQIFGLRPAQANAARVAINNLASALSSGKISAQDLDKAVTSLNTKSLVPLTGAAAVAAAQLGNLQAIVQGSSERLLITGAALFRIFEVFVIRRVMYAVIQQFNDAVAAAGKFSTEITKISIATDIVGSDLDKFKDKIVASGKAFGETRLDAASAAYQVYASHVTDAEGSTKLLDDALKLSKVTFTTAEEGSKALTSAIQGFGLQAEDSGRTVKLLFGVTDAARSPLKDVQQLIGQTSQSARLLGVSLEDTASLFVNLRQKQVPTEKAIQTINATFTKFLGSTSQLNEIFLKLGFTSAQSAVKQLGIAEALRLVSEEARNGSGRLKELADRFLEGDHDVSKLNASTKSLIDSTNKFDKALDTVSKSSEEKFKKIALSLKEFFIGGANFYRDALVAIVDLFSKGSDTSQIEAALKRIEDAHGAAREAAEKDSQSTERVYRGLFQKIDKAVLDHLVALRNQYQNHGAAVEEQFTSTAQIVHRIITDANKEIKSSEAFVKKFFEESERKGFERRISILPPAQQFDELQNRLDLLRARGRKFFEAGDRPAGEAAFTEARDIILRFIDLNNKLSKERVQTQQQLSNETIRHLRTLDQIGVSAQHLKGTDAERAKGAAELNKHLDNEVKILQQHSHQYSDEVLKANLLNELSLKRLEVELAIFEAKSRQQQRDIATEAKEKPAVIARAEEETIKRIRDLETQRKNIIEARAKQEKVPIEILKDIIFLEDTIIDRSKTNIIDRITGSGKFPQEVQLILESITRARKAFDIPLDAPGRADAIKDAIKEALGAIQELDVTKLGKSSKEAFEFRDVRKDLQGVIGSISQQLENIKSPEQLNQGLEKINREMESLRSAAGVTGDEIEGRFAGATKQAGNLNVQIQTFTANVDASIESIRRLTDEIGKAAGAAGNLRPPFIPAGGGGRQHGGFISGPGGIDKVPLWATAGEFIVNKESTDRFYPLLQAINARGYQSGGTVSNTSVGNVTVNMTATGTPQNTVRSMGDAIAREIRRGTLRI